MTGKGPKLLTQWSRVLPAKITDPQLAKKFAAFYETRRFITVFHKSPSPTLTLSQNNPNPRPHFLNIRFNFILPSTHRSSKWSLSLRFPHQNALRTYPLHTCRMPCPGHVILIDFITRVIFGAENMS